MQSFKEEKKKTHTHTRTVTQSDVDRRLSAENSGWPVVTRLSPAVNLTETQKQEDCWEKNWGDFKKKKFNRKKKAALTSSSLTTKPLIGLQCFSAPKHPVQRLHLLHTPSGSVADSQGLSQHPQLMLAVFCENLKRYVSDMWSEITERLSNEQKKTKNKKKKLFHWRVIRTLEHIFLFFSWFGLVEIFWRR